MNNNDAFSGESREQKALFTFECTVNDSAAASSLRIGSRPISLTDAFCALSGVETTNEHISALFRFSLNGRPADSLLRNSRHQSDYAI